MDQYFFALPSIDETPEQKNIVKASKPLDPSILYKDPSKLPLLRIQTSSVFYIILVYLPMQKILHMQQTNKRFYNIYVPIVLKNVTSLGITPCKRRNVFGCKVLPGVREL